MFDLDKVKVSYGHLKVAMCTFHMPCALFTNMVFCVDIPSYSCFVNRGKYLYCCVSLFFLAFIQFESTNTVIRSFEHCSKAILFIIRVWLCINKLNCICGCTLVGTLSLLASLPREVSKPVNRMVKKRLLGQLKL